MLLWSLLLCKLVLCNQKKNRTGYSVTKDACLECLLRHATSQVLAFCCGGCQPQHPAEDAHVHSLSQLPAAASCNRLHHTQLQAKPSRRCATLAHALTCLWLFCCVFACRRAADRNRMYVASEEERAADQEEAAKAAVVALGVVLGPVVILGALLAGSKLG